MFRQAGSRSASPGSARWSRARGVGGPQAYVDGLHNALRVGAALAARAAVATGLLIQSPARPSRSVKLAAEPAS